MAKLIYSALTSLDGYVADETGNLDWMEPIEEVHAYINSIQRQIGAYLFGRKMYETMPFGRRQMCCPSDTGHDVAVGGPALAAHAIRAGLVDEYHRLIAPIIVGSGNPYLPGKVSVKLELLDERRFDNGMVHVRYRAKS